MNMNLQLFSDDEMLESGGYQGEGEDPEVEEAKNQSLTDNDLEDDMEEGLDDDLDLEEEDEDDGSGLDKKTKAIIKHKREAKSYRDQAQALQDKLDSIEFEKKEAQRVNELTKTGVSNEEAVKTAKDEIEVEKLRSKLTAMELGQLEGKYPGITRYSRELSEAKQRLPEFSYEQLYLANYSKQNEFDRRTKLEQEIAYLNRQAQGRSLEGANPRTKKTTQLSNADERTYNFMKKSMPGLTRKRFKELSQNETLE